MKVNQLLSSAQNVIQSEANALIKLSQTLDDHFSDAIETIFHTQGRIILMGMGKSGHIARKIASTLSSTGSPSFFVHPGEATHGDLGMIQPNDTVIILSNSGRSDELSLILPYLRKFNIPFIAVTSNTKSPLSLHAKHTLALPELQEACTLSLAPTTSSTMMLALGDAIAVSLMEQRAFSKQDFALRHPSGQLGRILTTTMSDIMRPLSECPVVQTCTPLSEALITMSSKNMGCILVTCGGTYPKLKGIFTDGDLRRSIEKYEDWHSKNIDTLMSVDPIVAQANDLASQTLTDMKTHKISALPIVSSENTLLGICHLFDFYNMDIYENALQ
ncbi:MAG: KpsF/GutQ family sugar-phosphate isomerase [Candidatus Comchoanobacterales bacterium]